MSYIKFENLHKSFGNNEVLKDINFEIEKGKLVTLLGPSGCGKSTLLRCLAGLESVTDGKIYVDGEDVTHTSAKNRGIGMVFQQYSLFPNLNVAQNVAFGLKLKKGDIKFSAQEIDEKVTTILKTVGLSDKAKQYPGQLSGGQQQRAALARALVTKPKVLLLDEPLSAIDALLRSALQIEIRNLQKAFNMTAIFVTHDQDEAMVMSDVIHLMNEGKIEQSAAPAVIYTQPKTRFAASFIGSYNIVDAADFGKILNTSFNSKEVAFRPETVEISQSPIVKDGYISFEAQVVDSLPHGNILRYNVLCGGTKLDVDVLFKKSMIFDCNTKVHLAMRRENCIEV